MELHRVWLSIGVALWGTTVASAAGFTATVGGLGQDYASAVTTDAAGNSYVAGLTYSKDFPVTAGAVQTTFGGTSDAFVAKLGPDGKVIWATFLGGILDDAATGIALDATGNVIVAGYTRSADFPTANAAQSLLNVGASQGNFDAFVAKLDPTGSRLLYSTFLGGPDNDSGYGLAVDGAGNAYLAGTTSEASRPGMFVKKLDAQGAVAYTFFRANGSATSIAVDLAGGAYVAGTVLQQAVVFRVAPDGSREVWEKQLGGGAGAFPAALAVARDGSVWVGGMTQSADFPLVNALQTDLGARPLWKSADGGADWTAAAHLPFAFPQAMAVAPDALFAATTDAGMVKSTDGGVTWTLINQGIMDTALYVVAADPRHAATVYAGSSSTPGRLYRTTDGGAHWSIADTMQSGGVSTIAVDPQSANTVYVYWNNAQIRKTTDAGATWTTVPYSGSPLASFAADPAASGSLWGYSQFIYGGGFGTPTPPYLWHSTDGGATWTRLDSPAAILSGPILFDASTKPSTIYIGAQWRSDDGGQTWTALPKSEITTGVLGGLAVGPAGTLYAALTTDPAHTSGGARDVIYISRDRGQTWTAVGSTVFAVTALVPGNDPSTLFALARNSQTTGFVTRLTPDGGIVFSTFLGGGVSFGPQAIFAAEPTAMTWQNGVAALTLDRQGNVVVAGVTRATDFPLAGGATCANAGGADAFVATIAGDGSRLISVECFGGTQDDGVLAVAAERRGGVVAVGQTWSWDLALSPGLPPFVGFGDAMVFRTGAPWVVPRHRK